MLKYLLNQLGSLSMTQSKEWDTCWLCWGIFRINQLNIFIWLNYSRTHDYSVDRVLTSINTEVNNVLLALFQGCLSHNVGLRKVQIL